MKASSRKHIYGRPRNLEVSGTLNSWTFGNLCLDDWRDGPTVGRTHGSPERTNHRGWEEVLQGTVASLAPLRVRRPSSRSIHIDDATLSIIEAVGRKG